MIAHGSTVRIQVGVQGKAICVRTFVSMTSSHESTPYWWFLSRCPPPTTQAEPSVELQPVCYGRERVLGPYAATARRCWGQAFIRDHVGHIISQAAARLTPAA